MILKTAADLQAYGKKLASELKRPAVIELVGDVGVGKTTLTQGLAEGLGVQDAVTSPSFNISKRYAFPGGILVHYDFYRLPDPGLMADDLAETMADPEAVVVIEWGGDVTDLLPEQHICLELKINDDGTRTLERTGA